MYGLTTSVAVFSHTVAMSTAAQHPDYNFGWKALFYLVVFVICNAIRGSLEKHGGFLAGGVLGSIFMVATLLSVLAALFYFFAMVAN